MWVVLCAANGAPVLAAEGPRLDEVPGPSLATQGLPAPARWPMLRYERPLRILALTDMTSSTAGYQRIARRMRSELDVRYLGGGMDIYHVNDKWIEPQKDPTPKELADLTRQRAIEATDPTKMGQVRRHHLPKTSITSSTTTRCKRTSCALRARAASCWYSAAHYPPPSSPPSAEWPAVSTSRNSWMHGGSQRADVAELSGIPVAHLAGHTWIPLSQAAPGASALATGERAIFKRAIGKGVLLFCPTGPISSGGTASKPSGACWIMTRFGCAIGTRRSTRPAAARTPSPPTGTSRWPSREARCRRRSSTAPSPDPSPSRFTSQPRTEKSCFKKSGA